VVRNSSDEQSMEFALIENLQREDLNPMEEARAYQRLLSEFGLTQELLAQRFGKDRSSIANSLRLLGLPNEIKGLVESLKISMGHAKVLLGLARPDLQITLARRIVAEQLSVRQVEQLLAAEGRGKTKAAPKRAMTYPDLEEKLRKRLGAKVQIHTQRKGGRIEIHYYEPAELDRLVELMLA
jgi:ParB family chromosome partitioning protein